MTLKLKKERGKALSFKLLFLLFIYAFATLSAVNAALSPYNFCLSANILGNSILLPANTQEKRKGGGSKSSGGGRGGRSSGGSALNLKSNLNARGKTVFSLGARAIVPYTASRRFPLGLTPLLIPPIAALAIFPSLWLYGVYYIYSCDNNSDNTYLYNLIKNSSYSALNKTLITILIINRTQTIAINSILPNSTTASSSLDLPALNAVAVYLISFL
ncbi:hypothetical protein V2W45_1467173 [Cenococcum geophilum]